MIKNKCNEIIKVVAVTVMSIGLFSGIFIASNHIVLGAATNQQVTMPSTQVMANMLPHTEVIPENYPFPTFTVNLLDDSHAATQRSANALSPEQAAELGARYIWEVLGENADGKAVFMSYNMLPSTTRTHWVGMVSSGSARESFLQFSIDAVTGERISIHDNRRATNLPERTMTTAQFHAFEETTPANIERYTQLARTFAQKHFNLTDMTDIVFNGMRVEVIDRSNIGERDLSNTILTYRETLLRFTATDERGRSATLTISREMQRLYELTTQRNDIIPGFQLQNVETHSRREVSNQNDSRGRDSNIDRGTIGGNNITAGRGGLSAREYDFFRAISQDPSHPRYQEAKDLLNLSN